MTYPPPLSAKDKKSFAYKTVKDRLPAILGKVIDFVYRSWGGYRQKFGKEAENDINLINSALSKLHYQIQTNKPLEKLTDNKDDVHLWNKAFDNLVQSAKSPPSWFESPWLFIEPFMYRKINESFFNSKHLQGFDPFSEIKYHSFHSTKNAIIELCEYIYTIEEKGWDKIIDMEDLFHRIIKISLWGNKYDLSLSNMTVAKAIENPLANIDSFDPFIMRNDIQSVYNYLKRINEHHKSDLKPRIINLILDNSGFELFTDLLLCYFLIKIGYVDRIILHGKIMPWYVSDTTSHDLINLLNWLTNTGESVEDKHIYNNFYVEKPKDEPDRQDSHDKERRLSFTDKKAIKEAKHYGKWFAEQFLKLMKDQTKNVEGDKINTLLSSIEYKDNFFWTLPYDYSVMASVAPELYNDLSQSILLIFKGDLNFRKLVGDLTWPYTTPFREALRGFHPTALVTMRTNKSDLICGLSGEVVEIAEKEYPTNWMISGDYAIVEFDEQ